MILDGAGRLGIGTNVPVVKLSVAAGANEVTSLFGQGGTGISSIAIGNANAANSAGFIGYDNTNNYMGMVIGGDALPSGFNIYRSSKASLGQALTNIWTSYTGVLQIGQGFLVDYSPTPQFGIFSNSYFNGTNTVVLRTGGSGGLAFENIPN